MYRQQYSFCTIQNMSQVITKYVGRPREYVFKLNYVTLKMNQIKQNSKFYEQNSVCCNSSSTARQPASGHGLVNTSSPGIPTFIVEWGYHMEFYRNYSRVDISFYMTTDRH